MKIPVISLWQPYATLMAEGMKRIETRGYRIPKTLLNVPVGIHAATRKVTLDEALTFSKNGSMKRAFNIPESTRVAYPEMYRRTNELPRGAIIAVVRFWDCQPTEELVKWPGYLDDIEMPWQELHFGNYESGRFGWLTQFLCTYKLKPIPATGKQGVWYHEIPSEIAKVVAA